MLKTTIAKRYARALFESMPENKKLFEYLAELDKTVLTPHDFWQNPLIEPAQYTAFFQMTGEPFKAPKEWVSFGNVLVENGRMSLMPFIIEAYLLMCEKHMQVMITTASPFSTQEGKKLVDWAKDQIQKNMGQKIVPTLTVDESLLAGFKIESDTFVYDASLKHTLQNLEKVLL
jgi:F-type H+-transporting ATPase subunit delta